MNKINVLLLICLLASRFVFADDRYWVGPSTGNWNNSANWSSTSHGPGGAGIPGAADSVVIDDNATIQIDASPNIRALAVGGDVSTYNYNVTLYTASGSLLTISNYFRIDPHFTLYDSTSENVPFKIIFNGATNATGLVEGSWIFTGRVPVTGGSGASFTAEPGSLVTVKRYITSGKNTAVIVSDPSTLKFDLQSYYLMDNNMDATVPDATWAPDYVLYADVPINPRPIILTISGASVLVSGTLGKLKHLSPKPSYRALSVTLNALTADASLDLPDGSAIGTLNISSTNNHSLTVLTDKSDGSGVSANIGTVSINGDNTHVALATANSTAPATSYFLQVNYFNQTGGNFSLQDYNAYGGSSTLAVRRDFNQTGGTFLTRSTTTNAAAKFILEMNGPEFIYNRPFGNASTGQFIAMTSESIDNGRNNTILRINNDLLGYNGYFFVDKGVTLRTPLKVGRLELLKGTVNTTDTTLLTVADPDASAGIITGTTGESFVIGPFIRMTSSTSSYFLPTGKTPGLYIYDFFRPLTILPSTNALSAYKVEYFNTYYNDLSVAPPLKGVSNMEYWKVERISGAAASIKLALKSKLVGRSATDGIVAAHYINNNWVSEQGTVLNPGTADTGSVISKPVTDFGAFTFGYVSSQNDTAVLSTCPKDSTIFADPATCRAIISWSTPGAMFPQTLNSSGGDLRYKGTFAGHGYYESTLSYYWPDARDIAAKAGGHLATINNPAENRYILDNVVNRQDPTFYWIGLYNTGSAGQFSWVTGEPLSYTNWIPGQPDNLYGLNNPNPFIFEPYAQINPYDSLSRWNDNSFTLKSKYIAEFDSSLITYRQYSGPANGSVVEPGVYTICYEIYNRESSKRDSCCFNIIVVCSRPVVAVCPKNTTLVADPASCTVKANWTLPAPVFADSYNINHGDQLRLRGIFNGHGYYESSASYSWSQARDIASSAGGHLVTISSSAEDSFIVNKVTDRGEPAFSWIGLYSTGKAGEFKWVTGEPLSYTDWMPGEPNNLYGLNNPDTTIFEPYVQINPYDPLYRWNDNSGNLTARFLAEFENSAVIYRQYSGPAYGSTLAPGVYTICYEKTNAQTNKKDSCCFTVTVVCGQTNISSNGIGSGSLSPTLETLDVQAYPNPSHSSFLIRINNSEPGAKIKMQVTDVSGRTIEQRENIGNAQLLQFGSRYIPGIYFLKVTIGNKIITKKLVKE